MKQIWPNYSYSPATNVLTLTGLNIDRDQLLLVTAADRGRIMYNFADSSVTASAFTSGANTALTLVATTAGLTTTAALVIYYDDQVSGISGSVTASNLPIYLKDDFLADENLVGAVVFNANGANAFGVNGVTVGSIPSLPAGTNRIGVVTIGAGTVTIGAGTAQIGSVTASISGTVPISGTVTVGVLPDLTTSTDFEQAGTQIAAGFTNWGSVPVFLLNALTAGTAQIGSVTASISNFPATQAISIASVTIGNSITIGSLPALVAGTAQIGSVTASISNSVVTFYPLQGTAVSNTNFTSTTASTTLASAVAGREVLTVFSEGPGNLFISSGATCTTISYQVRLSSGDYWECPQGQLSLLHTAVFSASSSTARVCQVS